MTPAATTSLSEAFAAVREQMAQAATRSGRDPAEVRLIAVTKSVDTEMLLRAAHECDQKLFGENRADELLRKVAACPAVDFHYIGTLQTNKVRKVVGAASLIHSVDSERLLRAIDQRAAALGITQQLLLQISISGEESKQGIEPRDLDRLLHLANSELQAVQINGLMTMAPFVPAEEIRWIFEDLRALLAASDRDGPRVALRELSMGMTSDFEVAIEEGATLVRIGTALFAQG
ncbi:MAG: YggS family pyridoxal phosphate-dependent enzyme [Coriobacteriia bacterium]|nr:YggS family pyridoxal phosphate-dependent enzyme [Coriobacteriia bacterium]